MRQIGELATGPGRRNWFAPHALSSRSDGGCLRVSVVWFIWTIINLAGSDGSRRQQVGGRSVGGAGAGVGVVMLVVDRVKKEKKS